MEHITMQSTLKILGVSIQAGSTSQSHLMFSFLLGEDQEFVQATNWLS